MRSKVILLGESGHVATRRNFLYYLLDIYATNQVSRSVYYFIKFTEEDGVWLVIKKKSLELLPEYKRRMLAKKLGVNPYSANSIGAKDLKARLLVILNLEDA